MTKHLLDLHRVDELKNCNKQPSWLVIEVTYWEPRNWFVTYLGAVHQKRSCHYRISLIGYWDKGSTVGW